ncbi:hypothetical protein NZ698_16400 [Chryseobacterium sp. PBS4-4]|uniref:Uncharacterized protein n=1 Tax=Chryseobacterium edaphi TaxID=2976532 RepID=A0ABT2W987_9FLAO|nr:hypothetical protein [Chryseobacterium edaphi]MCU7618777.1 hypothetical protein [Chryseobacterium edaphi]
MSLILIIRKILKNHSQKLLRRNQSKKRQPHNLRNHNRDKIPTKSHFQIINLLQAKITNQITDAYFVNNNGQRLAKAVVGDWVRVCIHTSNMIGKHVQFVVWEYDTVKNDEIFRSGRLEVKGDMITT